MSDPASLHWVHNLDPFLLHISGDFGIRWYGVSYLVGILGGWWLLRRWSRNGRLPMSAHQVGDFVVTVAIGIVLGGRLGYAAMYEPALFWTFTSDLPFWKLLAVHQGGMASHGGIAGVAAATWWWSRRMRQDLLVLGDALATVAPFGLACGRLANFINGELWGRPWDGPWAVIFPGANPPVPRHPSQLYAMFLEGLLVFAVLLPIHARHRRPGLSLGLFFGLYGIGRFVGEFFREPDAGQPGYGTIPAILGFMSKGQAYTVPVLVIGICVMWYALRRPARPQAYPATPATSPPANPAP
jgi:phosphatidylglycerol---prolipoprotein diacylglyceryl transferase